MLPSLLALGAALFALGLVGFVTRRNLIIIFLCTELMFQGIVVTLVAFGRYPLAGNTPAVDGQMFSLFLLVVAAAEAALALAMVVLLFRYRGTLDANVFKQLRDA
ncbi:MAG: NADH-quinone oxidoreductase subunit NuoK [Phycisphaerales bacterium]|nr:NADH-quinone oxidoreductase subunit NuoK [Phycisphaerales bacterium]